MMFYENSPEYLPLLPEVLQDVEEIKAISKAVLPALEQLNQRIRQAVDNKFPSTVNASGAAQWEKLLGLSSPLNNTLQARRDAIRAKLISKPPINLSTLRKIVETYLGVPVDIELWWSEDERTWFAVKQDFPFWGELKAHRWADFHCTNEPYVIQIYYRGTNAIPNLEPLFETLYGIIPANLVLRVNYRYFTWREAEERFISWGEMQKRAWEQVRMGN